MSMIVPAGAPGTMPANLLEQTTRLANSSVPLKVTAIGFTDLAPLREGMMKCLPLLVPLVSLAHLGHSVIVFEGSEGAFEGAVQACDLLIIDSGMLPFIQKDWALKAWSVMNPGARLLIYLRRTGSLVPVVPSKQGDGWRYGEPDGENSYLNCLLVTLAKRPPIEVDLVASHSAPSLGALAADPEQLEWISELPFKYEALNTDKIIDAALQLAKLSRAVGAEGTLRAKFLINKTPVPVSFRLRLTRDEAGLERLSIQKT